MTQTTMEKRLVQLEKSVRQLQKKMDFDAAVEGIRRGLESADRREGESAKTFFSKLRKKHSRAKSR